MSSGELLYKICQDVDMPHKNTVYSWTFDRPEFGDKFRKALIQRAENWGEGIIEDIESCPPIPEALAKVKMLTDTKRWIMGKLLKQYADRTIVAGDKDNPIAIGIAAALDSRITAAKALPPPENGGVMIEGECVNVPENVDRED